MTVGVVGGVVLALAGALAACSTAEPPRVEPVKVQPTPLPTPQMFFVHEITFRGQTLGRIARWYTGKFENWEKLTRPVNPDLTVCCVPLRVGRKVKIPRELVERTDPLPRPVTRKAPPLKKREPEPTAEPTEAEPEEVEPTLAPEPTATREPTRPPPTEAPEEAEPEDDPLDIIGPR